MIGRNEVGMLQGWEKETPPPVLERGSWIATASGGMWSLLEPHPLDVRIGDIAAGLSRNCRYAGQIRHEVEFYSVTEHSVLMYEWLRDQGMIDHCEDGLKVLLHDGSEGYFVDMATPLKAILPEFRKLEDRCQTAIDVAFGIPSAKLSKEIIKMVDVRIRMDEREALINEPALSAQKRIVWEHTPDMDPLGVTIRGLLPRQARDAFLQCFVDICETLPLRDPRNETRILRHLEEARRFLSAPSCEEAGSERSVDADHCPDAIDP